jgi:hypothetical protein
MSTGGRHKIDLLDIFNVWSEELFTALKAEVPVLPYQNAPRFMKEHFKKPHRLRPFLLVRAA